jgi:hypothetical protein
METGKNDKNNTAIKIGDTVKFKCYGNNYITATVYKTKNGFSPFDDTIPIEMSPYTEPSECVVI